MSQTNGDAPATLEIRDLHATWRAGRSFAAST